jgi:hypothetical protein
MHPDVPRGTGINSGTESKIPARRRRELFHHEEMKGTKKDIKFIFPLASCSVETNPFEKVVLSQTLFRKLLPVFIPLRLCAFVR